MNKKRIIPIILLFAILFTSSANSTNITDDGSFTTIVFDGNHSPIPYRIPALTETRKGNLLAACDFRINRADIGWNHANGLWQINVVMKESKDFGKTWSDSVCVARGDEHSPNPVFSAFGDPSIVADRTSNNVLLHCVAGRTGYQTATRDNPQHAVFFHSKDNGKTWDKGHDLTEMIYSLYDNKLPNGGKADGIFLTSGKIMQSRYIKKGKYYRLYIAHPIRQQGVERCGTFVIFSDDFGYTWHTLGNPSIAPSIAQDESKIEELPDGSVLLSCRDVHGGRRFNIFRYHNSLTAEGSWGKEVMPSNMTAKDVNACNGEILIVPAERNYDKRKLYIALQSIPLSSKRDSVGFYYKELANHEDYSTPENLSKNWIKGLCVTPESSCYSTMILMSNQRIGFLYEVRGQYDGYDIEFKSLDLNDITNGKYSLSSTVVRTSSKP